ncbi:MAG: glycyl-radical enzyme activating protein [Elusimicrobiaceae bacterium]
MTAQEPLLFDIQGYCLHDGPGIRTALFFSGCPLSCFWCANPEGQLAQRRLFYREALCGCEKQDCVPSCACGAIASRGGKIRIDREKCGPCTAFPCSASCRHNALEVLGRRYSLEELFKILRRDSFYWGKDGGVTLTGGEPLAQYESVRAILEFCGDNGFHTVLESSCYAELEIFLSVAKKADWLFADIKHMDSREHLRATGTGNEKILANIATLAKSGWAGRLVVRLPVIPGYNNSAKNITDTAEFMAAAGLGEINLLPYHGLGESKYKNLGLEHEWVGTQPPSAEELRRAAGIFESRAIACFIGSDTPF